MVPSWCGCFHAQTLVRSSHSLTAAVSILLGVYQSDIPLIRLRLLVQQSKDAVRTRKAHDHHVYLVGHLADGAGKLFCHVQERYHDADAECHAGNADIGYICQQQCTAYQGYYYIHYVADIAQQRHQNVGKAVAVAGIEEDLAVYFIKVGFGLLLMAEHLDHLLASHHLFHKCLGLSQRNLLAQEIFRRTVGNGSGCKHHADDANHYDQA